MLPLWTLALNLLVVVEATSSSFGPTHPSPSTSPSATATHSIAVGADGFVFSPKIVSNASIGDIIEFHFFPGGHAVSRAEFKYPCIPYEYTGKEKKGFSSGSRHPQVISYDESNFYRVRVNDTSPVFFYCSIPGSCKDEHMIGAINPNISQTFDLQMQYTLNTSLELAPGQPFPSEVPHPTAEPTVAPKKGFNTSHIIGTVVGVAVALIAAGALVYILRRRRKEQSASRDETQPTAPPSSSMCHGAVSSPTPTMSFQFQQPDAHGQEPACSSPVPARLFSPLSEYNGEDNTHPGTSESTHFVHPQHLSPVELPSSPKSPHLAPPQYRHESWTPGDETNYRPSK